MTRRTVPILLLLVMSLAWSPAAVAQSQQDQALYLRILQDYVNNGGRFTACKFTEGELKQAIRDIPEDLKQYNAPLIAALEDAIAARAQGGCNKKNETTTPGSSTGTTPPAQAGRPPPPRTSGAKVAPSTGGTPAAVATPGVAQPTPTPTAEPAPAAAVAADDSVALASRSVEVATDAPFPMIALAILAGLLAMTALAFGVVRWFAWEPAWAIRFRHAAGEAGWRASSTFSEFADFVRLGR